MLMKFVLLVVFFFGVCGFARILMMRLNACVQQIGSLRQQIAQNDAKLYAQMEQVQAMQAAQSASGGPTEATDSQFANKGR